MWSWRSTLGISCLNGTSIEVMDGSKDEYLSGLEDSKLDQVIISVSTALNANSSRLVTRNILQTLAYSYLYKT